MNNIFGWVFGALVLLGLFIGVSSVLAKGESPEGQNVNGGEIVDYRIEQDPELVRQVTKEDATEPAFRNAYWNNKHPGLYLDPYTGEPLFASIHKYKSGTGWPSFYKVLGQDVEQKEDRNFGMKRIEVRSRSSDSHLGHLFADGPALTGQRYCINSAALRFVPQEDLQQEGLSDYQVLFADNPQQDSKNNSAFAGAIFAGGCFWCTESAYEGLEGVVRVLSGYTGGRDANPSYEQVSRGDSGHYEAVLVLYEPSVISYEELLQVFWRQIDPTDGGGQFADRGSQYYTAIFYRNEAERLAAERSKTQLEGQGTFGAEKIVTQILPERDFYLAEDYHQDYAQKNPLRYKSYVQGSGRKYFLQSTWNQRP